MEDAEVQKPWIEEVLFCGTKVMKLLSQKVMKLLSHLRMRLKTDFISRGVPTCKYTEYFFKCERQWLCYEILERF